MAHPGTYRVGLKGLWPPYLLPFPAFPGMTLSPDPQPCCSLIPQFMPIHNVFVGASICLGSISSLSLFLSLNSVGHILWGQSTLSQVGEVLRA